MLLLLAVWLVPRGRRRPVEDCPRRLGDDLDDPVHLVLGGDEGRRQADRVIQHAGD
jgi:hypothetical protein